ncbi:Protein of uncharacterised function (DUF551) [Enterobacter hormaechei]|uniref:DUF551 domain-containing protein n=4 Tax=Enterobacter hormaechei TaxID=158836 RepID=UPI00125A7FE1|nr:DUF551 domain-containing protein [Enterobacter hormaechei]MCM7073218.1 DUF551 domain-containing protein [Enterobacter hormaechei]MCM7091283.1 DUF551 domain-containing protein [Enterobacter hormaechei]MCR3988108.1 DUF551 domain-containing protein [Enterobacter hormaechei]MCR3993884.1 DUF551 domain-containing protein [Enterobacter hormaechei]MCR3998073.1 DUF551 domain-containing protein [Enterobacter hormaechei]
MKITKQEVQAVSGLRAGYTLGHADVTILNELARIALASLEAQPVTEWTNEQCLEFLSIAFRHAKIKGDLEFDDIRLGVKMVNCSRAAVLQGKAELVTAHPELTVWYGSMPETNGKTNWTAMLHRKGHHPWEGITIDRSEYPERVRYEADRMRHLIGELTDEPDILAYDADAHSGYAEPVSQRDELPLDYLQGQKDGLEWAAQLAEANHPHTGDWLYDDPVELAKAIRKGPDMPELKSVPADADDNFYSWFCREWEQNYQPNRYSLSAKKHLGAIAESAWFACRAAMLQGADGNSPVIPDGWVACSERIPEIGTEIFYFCQGDGLRDCGIVSSSNFSGKGDAQLYVHAEGYDLRLGVDITHWMPLPAAPQQE